MSAEKTREITPSLFRYTCPDDWSDEKKEENHIDAKEIEEAIKGGKIVEIINAVIDGQFILRDINVESEITIERTTIRGFVDWSYSTFKRVLSLENSIFKNDAIFTETILEKDIFLPGATFQGKAVFSDLSAIGNFYSRSTTFEKEALFSRAIFEKRIDFGQNIFNGEANFEGVRIGGDAEFTQTEFKQQARFNFTQIDGNALFYGARFKQLDIYYTQIEGVAGFNSVIFEDEANFVCARIGGIAEFVDTKFKQQARFNNARIDGAALFDSAIFEGEADFGHARIGGITEFDGARFRRRASFNGARTEGALFNSAIFEDEANFVSIKIDANAEFIKTEFKQEASFNGARIGGFAGFNEAQFKWASFNTVQIELAALFNSAIFEGEADFWGAEIGANAEFAGARFEQQAIFNGAQIKGDIYFMGTTVANVYFQNTSFRTAYFGEYLFSWDEVPGNDSVRLVEFLKQEFDISWVETAKIEKIDDVRTIRVADEKNYLSLGLNNEKTKVNLKIDDGRSAEFIAKSENGKLNIYFEDFGKQFHGKIDLRGCSYNRIQPIHIWEQLMDRLDPYDRQPFTQLEETFRRSGLDELANDVYHKRKRLESGQKTYKKNLGAWMMDRFLWRLTGYGVRLKQLLLFIIPLLIIGTFIFTLEGAVEPAIKSPWDAFWVSFSTFLPVEIPSGAAWKPTSDVIQLLGIKFTTFATILKLAGWILVPVGVAGISGLLKR
jgi:hypothetical protein